MISSTTPINQQTPKNHTVYVFIDVANIWQAQKAQGKIFDYQALQEALKKEYNTQDLQIFYYEAYPADGTRKYSLDKKHKFFTFLKKKLRFIVRKKELKRIAICENGINKIIEKGNMDVELTLDVVHYLNNYDIALFFTGDADFLALVKYLQKNQKQVHVYSTKNNVSHELRTKSNSYTDILDMPKCIWKGDLVHRNSHSHQGE